MNRLKSTKEALEKIVELEGECLHRYICECCPFKKKCLPTFLHKKTRMTSPERLSLALDILTNIELLDENEEIDVTQFFEARQI